MANKRIVSSKDITLFSDFPMPLQYKSNHDFEISVLAYWQKRDNAKYELVKKNLNTKRRLTKRLIRLKLNYDLDFMELKNEGFVDDEIDDILDNHPFKQFFMHHLILNPDPGGSSELLDFIFLTRPSLGIELMKFLTGQLKTLKKQT